MLKAHVSHDAISLICSRVLGTCRRTIRDAFHGRLLTLSLTENLWGGSGAGHRLLLLVIRLSGPLWIAGA